jgi:ATP-dependent DNA ligase
MALPLPLPMLARGGPIPTGDYAYELKLDGFRGLVNRDDGFAARSGQSITPSPSPW